MRLFNGCVCVALLVLAAVVPVAALETTPSEEAAIQAYRQGAFSQAVNLYTKALSETEDAEHRARLHVNIGWTLFALGRTDEVDTHLHAALVEDPALSLIPDYYTDEFLEIFEEARRFVVDGETAEAAPLPDLEGTLATIDARIDEESDLEGVLADIDSLLSAYPMDGRLVPLKVQVLTMLGRTDAAQELAQGRADSLSSIPNPAVVPIPDLILRANHLLEEGDAETALELIRGAVSRQPTNVTALELMAEAGQSSGRWQEAEFALKTALELQPDDIGLNLRLGELYLEMDNASASRDIFRRLTEQFPRSDRAWAALGLLEARLGNYDQAETALTRALSENPLLAEVQLALGELLLRNHQVDQALQALSAASNLMPGDPAVQGRTGQALLALGRVDEAETVLQTAIDQGFDGFDIRRALALCQIHQGNLLQAERSLERLGSGAQGDGDLLKALLLLKRDQPAEAFAILEPLAQTRLGDPRILNLMGVALYRMERYEDAVQVFTQSFEMAPDRETLQTNLARAEAARIAVDLQAQALTPAALPQ